MIYTFIFIFGLIVGSFLNAYIYRLSVNQSVFRGRSFCPACQHQLSHKDLIPVVSFILLQGKCRYCHKSISWQYPVVELATALSFIIIYQKLASTMEMELGLIMALLAFMVYTAYLIIIFVYDLKHYLILDKVVIPALAIAFIFNIYLGLIWWQMLLGAAAAAGFFAAQFFLSKGRWIGGGDIRLGAFMGIMLSWPQVLVALFLAYLLGSIIGIFLLIAGKKKMGSKVPFGTFLTVATFITLLYGQELLNWYLNMMYL